MAILVQSNKKPSVSFPEQTGSIVTFNSQYAGLPLKSCKIAVTSQSGVSEINIGSDNKYAGFITWNQIVENSHISGQSEGTDTASSLRFYFRAGASPYNTYYSSSFNAPKKISALIKPTVGSNNLQFIHSGVTRNLRFYSSDYGMIVDHIYYMNIDFTAVDITTVGGVVWKDLQLIDLTVVLGITKANEIYTMEQVQAGAGIVYIKGLFPNDYYPYDSGTLSTVSAVNGSTNSFFTIPIGQTVNEGEYDARTGILEVTSPTEQTIQLPPCPIDTLQGENNLFASTGETTAQYIKIGG